MNLRLFGKVDFKEDEKKEEKMRGENFFEGVSLEGGEGKHSGLTKKCSLQNGEKIGGGGRREGGGSGRERK